MLYGYGLHTNEVLEKSVREADGVGLRFQKEFTFVESNRATMMNFSYHTEHAGRNRIYLVTTLPILSGRPAEGIAGVPSRASGRCSRPARLVE